jgi:hypothetical protein
VRSAVIFFTHRGQYSNAVALAGAKFFTMMLCRCSASETKRRVIPSSASIEPVSMS